MRKLTRRALFVVPVVLPVAALAASIPPAPIAPPVPTWEKVLAEALERFTADFVAAFEDAFINGNPAHRITGLAEFSDRHQRMTRGANMFEGTGEGVSGFVIHDDLPLVK